MKQPVEKVAKRKIYKIIRLFSIEISDYDASSVYIQK